MHKYVISVLFIALICPVAGVAAPPATAASLLQPAGGAPTRWTCATTQASGLKFFEYDTIERIGVWSHGTARSVTGSADVPPYYDYYFGYADSHWVYIQIDPIRGTYFVAASEGNSLDGRWSIVYPAEQSNYKFTIDPSTFTIRYPDLTQVCRKSGTGTMDRPAPTLTCTTGETGSWLLEKSALSTEYLSIAQKGKPGTRWWQGVATDAPSGGKVIYEYNIFTIGSHRVSVLVNSSGAYAVATSYALDNLDNSVWMVAYPTVESGFAFTGVSPQNALPTQFTVIFKDGYQECAPMSGQL
jgi:hypothetical protein